MADPTWQPFLITPLVPDYPSTNRVLGWAAAEVLIDILGDRIRYTADGLTLPDVTREFRGFSAAAQENGLSRLYAGIHFRYAVAEDAVKAVALAGQWPKRLRRFGDPPCQFR